MKNKKFFYAALLVSLCLLFGGIGCGNSNNNTGSAQKPLVNPSNTANSGSASSGTSKVGTTGNTGSADFSERRVLADRICRLTKGIEGVQDASVLIADAAETASSSTNNASAGKSPVAPDNASDDTGKGSASSRSNNSQSDRSSNTGNVSGIGYTSGKTAGNSTRTTQKQPAYTALVGVTCTEALKNDNTRQTELAQKIRQQILKEENQIQEVIVTTDENDIRNIGNLAGNMLETSGKEAVNEVNRLRDKLSNAGSNLVNDTRDITNDIGKGLKELVK